MTVYVVRYWPSRNDPAREGALCRVLTQNKSGCMVESYGHQSWWSTWDELEIVVETEGD